MYPQSVEINGTSLQIIVEEKRKRHSSAVFKDNVIIVRVPTRLSFSKKLYHVESLVESMKKKLSQVSLPRHFEEVFNRGYFYLGGECFEFVVENKRRNISFKNSTFYVPSDISLFYLEKFVQKKLCEYFQPLIAQKLYEVNQKTFKYSYGRVSVKVASSAWGHCTSLNDIMINLKLLNASNEVFEYIIIHELAHIAVKDHSSRFWKTVEVFCPNHKELRKTLKRSPPELYG